MILSHEHKFIFIHIGKTGGTSIEKVLCKHLGIDFDLTIKNPKNGNWWKHAWSSGMRSHVGKDIWNDYFTFGFVRNPYDMLLSLYSMYTQYPEYIDPINHNNLYHPWNQFEDFEDLVMSMGEGVHEPDNKWKKQLKKLGAPNTMRVWNSLKNLQSKYLCDEQDDIIVDYVGKFENLQNDFNHCCDRIGIEQLDLIKHGATRHRSFKDIYTPAMREIVKAHSGKDIERFNYASSLDEINVT